MSERSKPLNSSECRLYPLELGIKASLVIADTGIHGNTREAIQKVEAKGQEVLSHFHEIGQLTQQVEEALK